MSQPFEIQIIDRAQLEEDKLRGQVELGHYFVFLKDGALLAPSGRRGRLESHRHRGRPVAIPLTDQAVKLPGVEIVPRRPSVAPIAAIVTDRDLYRAERDTAHLFIAAPGRPELTLHLLHNGALLTERSIGLSPEGVCMEELPMLLAGRYRAELHDERGTEVSQAAEFVVAEYSLAPLSGRLVTHALDRKTQASSFTLEVESYQVPFERSLLVELVEDGRTLDRVELEPLAAGRYEGRLGLSGVGPHRLRLSDASDPSRVTEIALPGSRAQERDQTVISELGEETLFSMMPEPSAIPARGGYLSAGDHIAAPITIESVVSDRPKLEIHAEVRGLSVVVLDLLTGTFSSHEMGDKQAGESIELEIDTTMASLFIGCFVGDAPFEGYTAHFRRQRLELELEVPSKKKPKEELELRISVRGTEHEVPVLVSIRDQRLTVRDTADVALGAAAKAAIAKVTLAMNEDVAFVPIEDALEPMLRPVYAGQGAGGLPPDLMFGGRQSLPRARGFAPMSMRAEIASVEVEEAYDMPEASAPMMMSLGMDELAVDGAASGLPLGLPPKEKKQAKGGAPQTRSAPRGEMPEVLFFGLIDIKGEQTLRFRLGDALTTYAIEAFALCEGDWARTSTTLVVDQPVRADLDLPPAIHGEDRVEGRLRISSESGRAAVRLFRNGESVLLEGPNGRLEPRAEIQTPVELSFVATAGTYRAVVEDIDTKETDEQQVVVTEPGRFKSLVRELALVEAGRTLTLDSEDALSMRVLPAVDSKLEVLIDSTASYEHLCCEQTGAKILSAVVMYLMADSTKKRSDAEQIIIAGVEREKSMHIKGKGFAPYPGYKDVATYYTPSVVRYLWTLAEIESLPSLPIALKRAVSAGLAMANNVAEGTKMKRVPDRIESIEDAHAAATSGEREGLARARAYVEETIDFAGPTVRTEAYAPKLGGRGIGLVRRLIGQPDVPTFLDPVNERRHLAYAAAILLLSNDTARAVRLANVVTRSLNEQGRLYSTYDSAAAIALFVQIEKSGVGTGQGRVEVNGRAMSTHEATALKDQVESVRVEDGVALIEVTRIHEEDWSSFSADLPLSVGFRDASGKRMSRFAAGDRTDLVVRLSKGYQFGDLLHVSLPASLAWIEGGGRVKQLSLDFAGEEELRVPLVVTHAVEGMQHFAICVRNMFEESRATSPGLLSIRGN